MISGLCPFHVTWTITCGGERSGRASKGVFFMAQIDPKIVKRVIMRITKRFRMESAMSFSIMTAPNTQS